MQETVTLSVGQGFHLKRGKDRITYAGMVSEDVFSVAQRKANGYQGYAWNLFFQKRQQHITLDGVNIDVENVNPEEIRLRVE